MARRAAIEQREYDPRREERRKATRIPLPDDVDPRMLEDESRRELRSLSKETSDLVARHLVMTGRLMDDEPEQALAHARAARALAGRIGVVRQAAGLAAYAAGEWNEALSELRAARRITGRPEHLAVFADCERALGRPERALAYGEDPQVPSLSQDERVELVIVLAGARRDLGQADAAVLMLQDPAKRTSATRPWAARLWYAYADALLDAGRDEQAREWFERTAGVDVDGQTDAADRVLALDGVALDLEDEADSDSDGPALDDQALQALVVEAFGSGPTGATVPEPAPEVEADSPREERATGEPSRAYSPFSGQVPVEETSSSRPSAALTPTFAAPEEADEPVGQPPSEASDPGARRSDTEGDRDPDDDGELTLFE